MSTSFFHGKSESHFTLILKDPEMISLIGRLINNCACANEQFTDHASTPLVANTRVGGQFCTCNMRMITLLRVIHMDRIVFLIKCSGCLINTILITKSIILHYFNVLRKIFYCKINYFLQSKNNKMKEKITMMIVAVNMNDG